MNAMSPIPPLKTGQLPQILVRLSDESEKAGWTEVKALSSLMFEKHLTLCPILYLLINYSHMD